MSNSVWERKRFCNRKCWSNNTEKKGKKTTTQVGFRLLDTEVDTLAKEARKNNVPLSELLRLGVRAYYKKLLGWREI